jgi:hypothetical protein
MRRRVDSDLWSILMFVEIVPSAIKFQYDVTAITSLLRKVESTIKDNKSVFAAVLSATEVPAYKDRISPDTLLKCLTPGNPPAVTPMHQMYLAQGRDPDWVVRGLAGPPLRITVLGELVLLWQKKPGNYFLTRQLTSIISMGLVNALLDSMGDLPSFNETVELSINGIPDYLKSFAKEAFGKLGWSVYQYCPVRDYFDAAGYDLPIPNPNATHP